MSTSKQDALAALSIAQAAARLRSGEVSSRQLTEACLARIAVYDPMLDAFITVMKDKALAQADQLDAEQKAGKLRGPLHGVPIALKDNIDTAGTRTTAASALWEDRVPPADAPVASRLKQAGAVIIGKTNLHEFAMGAGEASFWGAARNPWALNLNTGGSSSGSGAAVAADLCYGALGTDTAGSIRHPAAYCSLVGLKPTFGLVPIRGIAPLTLCLDHCGPMTRTVEDNAIMLNALVGYDRRDITSVEHKREDYVAALKQPVSGFRLGAPLGFKEGTHPEILRVCGIAFEVLARITAGIKDVSLPSTGDLSIGALGYSGETWAWHEETFKDSPGKYQLASRRRLEGAAKDEPKAPDYIRTKWKLDLLRRTIDDSFTDFDLVVMPTMRKMQPVLNDMFKRIREPKPGDPSALSNCSVFNATGLPAISIPCGFSSDGLPIGLMIAGPRFSEGKILALAQAYERETRWYRQKPKLTPDTLVPALTV
ncbi:amidase [Nevskia sp.]|uniref:amidase n=1 Tax=Nevskia sp. TaxID=1929292 RepID=UPI0025F0252E|nr:amidase [Nevskia sp.]